MRFCPVCVMAGRVQPAVILNNTGSDGAGLSPRRPAQASRTMAVPSAQYPVPGGVLATTAGHQLWEGESMTADPGIVRAIDRAAAPIERFAALMEAIPAGRDPMQVYRGFLDLHRELASSGVGTHNGGLYARAEPVSAELFAAIVADLSDRIGEVCGRIADAAAETSRRTEEIGQRLIRLRMLLIAPEGSA